MKTNIQRAIAFQFGIDFNALYLTHPTFFSRLTNAPAKTVHDEYWHPHVDKVICLIMFLLFVAENVLELKELAH